MNEISAAWRQTVDRVFEDATLQVPNAAAFQQGGKWGVHTEHLGPLLAEMQYLQRTYPDVSW